MQRRDEDTSGYLRPPGICRRLFSLVVAKIMANRFRRETLGQGEEEVLVSNEVKEDGSARNKLSKKESRSDIIIHFKQKEDSEENGKPANKLGSSRHEAEKETPIKLVNGNGRKKTVSINEKGKAIVSEPSPMQPVALPANGKSKPQKHHRPLLNVVSNINEKSDAFIRSRKEKMRKSLEPKT
ncbi:PREDICTED: uncharacterized protein LOC104823063 [Tarenaya hassleriana]|uniref:uncharacterized protein LOC104823063 n=1 Tax=Tarenaya hassleriana TaxID=28532 RepID=UPI00053C7308|nr:PREDICTED: uncharacterized protein LOC104823063 [Tarenaya hassleriana]